MYILKMEKNNSRMTDYDEAFLRTTTRKINKMIRLYVYTLCIIFNLCKGGIQAVIIETRNIVVTIIMFIITFGVYLFLHCRNDFSKY